LLVPRRGASPTKEGGAERLISVDIIDKTKRKPGSAKLWTHHDPADCTVPIDVEPQLLNGSLSAAEFKPIRVLFISHRDQARLRKSLHKINKVHWRVVQQSVILGCPPLQGIQALYHRLQVVPQPHASHSGG